MSKTIRLLPLLALIAGCATPAQAEISAEQRIQVCDAMVDLYETAINMRGLGKPEHTAYIAVAKELDHQWQQEMWAEIVTNVYALPRSEIKGAGKADTLTTVWNACLSTEI